MRVCHIASARFDDPNLVSCAGLIPVMRLAERAGLHDLARTHVRVPGSAGANAEVKVTALVAGADTIDAMDLLRHGGSGRVLTPGRAPSTLGTFLRAFTFGHVRQFDAVASRVLVNLAARTPLLVGADQVAYLDIDARHQSHLRLRQAGRGLRVLQGQRIERVARERLDGAVGTGNRRDPAAPRPDDLHADRTRQVTRHLHDDEPDGTFGRWNDDAPKQECLAGRWCRKAVDGESSRPSHRSGSRLSETCAGDERA